MNSLTQKQKRVFEYVEAYIETSGDSPTIEEIMRDLKFRSPASVHEHLVTLEKAGYIKRIPRVSRGIRVVEKAPQPKDWEIPMLGYVAAGNPIEAILTPETVCVPSDMVGRNRTFALRVKGDSMIDEHIMDGDTIIVEARKTAENGDTVVALVDGQDATVKKFYRERAAVRLVPANRNYAPIVVKPPHRVAIQGTVVGVLRRLQR